MPVGAEAAVVAATAAPVLAFAGSWLGVRGNRRASVELDRWRRREETMRLLRWAAELVVDGDERRATVGVAALDALQASEMLQDEDLEPVEAVSQSLIDDNVVEYDQNAEAGDDDGMTFVDAGRRDRAREWRGPQAWRRRR